MPAATTTCSASMRSPVSSVTTPASALMYSDRGVLQQLMACGPGRSGPVGNHPIAADSPGGRFEQTVEVALGLRGKRLAMASASRASHREMPWSSMTWRAPGIDQSFLRPNFLPRRRAAVGGLKRFAGMDLLLPPQPVGFLERGGRARDRSTSPEHPGFTEAAGLGMGECSCL